ncbi:MAG: hypothetical protein LBC86_06580 [Oscillospiraceae bacterium]|jgi:hypothetical protein|nr:hypothetical protein [Oscillospiraceae bacterium]
MRSKKDFYPIFYEQLARKGLEARKSESSDYVADIYNKGKLAAFFTKSDTIVKNPYVDVSDKIIDTINDIARTAAVKSGICVECPYDEQKHELLSNGSYKLSEFGDTILACKKHPLFDYVLSTYKQTEDNEIIQRKFFYNQEEAMRDFAARSGLVDERRLLTDEQFEAIHVNLVKTMITPGNNLTHEELNEVEALVNKIEEINPALAGKNITLDRSHIYIHTHEHDEGFEVG